ncbi:hypothetical protein [Streptomyces sp. B6B3]|uniref:hypothetical protein n=1 Tax=Streptomyces sp. B6B3 TaxID=3153570 RepID=UPI00325D5C2A
MSSNYQQPQRPHQQQPYQQQPPQQQPYYAAPQQAAPQQGGPQHGAPYYPPGGAAPQPPGGGKKRGPLIAVAVVVAIALGVGGVMFLGGDDDGGPGGGGGSDVALTPNPDLEPMDFPDAQALGYDEGADAACEAVSEIMTARGYEFQSAENNDGGIDCWYATPAASSFEDGTNHITANVYMSMGAVAEDAYASFTSAMASYTEGENGGGTTYGPLYELPVGEEGWIRHNQTDVRGDGTASFRKEGTTFYVTAYGWIEQGDTDEPLTEETTFREITDIITALGGGEAGEPQISESAAEEYPGELPEFGDPVLPAEGSGEERCAALTTVATEQLDSQVMGTGTDTIGGVVPTTFCNYEPAESAYGQSDTGIRNIRLTMNNYTDNDVSYAAGDLGSQLRHTMERTETEDGFGQLYALPAGTSGYMIYNADEYGSSFLEAGWVVGDNYITISLSGFLVIEGFDQRAFTEEEMVADLSALLTAMGG